MPNTKSGHIYWRGWDFDYDVPWFEGLCLLNGTFRGRRAFGKLSMPAIRVKYKVDGGVHDWRRPLGKGAGPYADRIRWKLGGDYGLQKIANRGDQYIGFNAYNLGGQQWMELSIYARIGAYHLSQQWHLSEDGWIAPRIWSKGLTINMDHHHHPYWRFDFDIDGADQNRVYRLDRVSNTLRFYPKEANDIKDPQQDTIWRVQNELTRSGVWIIPSKRPEIDDGEPHADDGVADDFSRIDIGVRRFNADEELHPWRYEHGWGLLYPWWLGFVGLPPIPRPNWDWQFDTGGLGFLNGEDVDRTDIVFWYVSHMHHHASEGEDHWHASGPNLKFDFNWPRPPREGNTVYFSVEGIAAGKRGLSRKPGEMAGVVSDDGEYELRLDPDGVLRYRHIPTGGILNSWGGPNADELNPTITSGGLVLAVKGPDVPSTPVTDNFFVFPSFLRIENGGYFAVYDQVGNKLWPRDFR